MAIDVTTNPHQGINAHLHSKLQTLYSKTECSQPDSWESFHADCMTYTQPPLHFHIYIAADQQRILNCITVIQAVLSD